MAQVRGNRMREGTGEREERREETKIRPLKGKEKEEKQTGEKKTNRARGYVNVYSVAVHVHHESSCVPSRRKKRSINVPWMGGRGREREQGVK